MWPIIDPILVTFGKICNFRDPNLVTYHFYELTHFLDWMKNNLLFIYSTNILVRLLTVNMKNCLTPKNPKMCDPILVTLLKMRPHYSQSSRENATPSSGTSPLASYKKVAPPRVLPPGGSSTVKQGRWQIFHQPVLELETFCTGRSKDRFRRYDYCLGLSCATSIRHDFTTDRVG